MKNSEFATTVKNRPRVVCVFFLLKDFETEDGIFIENGTEVYHDQFQGHISHVFVCDVLHRSRLVINPEVLQFLGYRQVY